MRINAMSDLSWEYIYIQTDSAVVFARLGYELALATGNEKKQAQLLNANGVALVVQSELLQAKDLFLKSFALAEKNNDAAGLASALNNLGSVSYHQGILPEALQHYNKSYEYFIATKNKNGQAKALNNLGLIYEEQGDLEKALINYGASLQIKEELGTSRGTSFLNLGNIYQQMSDLDKARSYYEKSLEIFREENDRWNEGDALTDLASIEVELAKFAEAIRYYDKSIAVFRSLGNQDGEAFALQRLGGVRLLTREYEVAKTLCTSALRLAEETRSLSNQGEACECLAKAYEGLNDYRNALRYQQVSLTLRDSLKKIQNMDELARESITHDFEMKQLADSLSREEEKLKTAFEYSQQFTRKKNERNIFLISALAILVLAITLASRLRYMSKTKKIIQNERQRSDELLLNILPAEVAQELKDTGKAEAKSFVEATVLFTDFKGFTEMSESMTAKELIDEVDACFQNFDVIVQRFGLEKIKTIGDSYMAVAGLPEENKANAKSAVLAALEMMRFIEDRHAQREEINTHAFRMRVGLNSGPVIAGVVGLKKFQYDVWGDAVNIASRMESSGEVGRVNISETTFRLLEREPSLRFIPRGKIAAKNKGEMEMYFVEKV